MRIRIENEIQFQKYSYILYLFFFWDWESTSSSTIIVMSLVSRNVTTKTKITRDAHDIDTHIDTHYSGINIMMS